MSNRLLIISSIALIIFISACTKTEKPAQKNNEIPLNSCSSSNANFPVICFDSLLVDCRCPYNATCIWEGYATVKLSLNNINSIQSFALSTMRNTFYPLPPNDTIINGWHIKLSGVTSGLDIHQQYLTPTVTLEVAR